MFACTAGLGLEDIIHKFKEVRQEVSTSPLPLAAYHAVPLWEGLPFLLSADPLHNCVYLQAGDDYSYIMAEALADRLAEAFAEKLHEMVRKDMWGYAPQESLSVDDMLKVKYQVRLWRLGMHSAFFVLCHSCVTS